MALILSGVARAKPGDVYLADDSGPNDIFRLRPGGLMQSVGSAGNLEFPVGIALDRKGRVLVADEDAPAADDTGAVIRIDPRTGNQVLISTNAKSAGAGGAQAFVDPFGIAVAPSGDIVVGDRAALIRVSPKTGRQRVIASGPKFDSVYDVAVALDGTIYAIGANSIQRVRGTKVKTIASGLPLVDPGGIELEPNGRMLIADRTRRPSIVST